MGEADSRRQRDNVNKEIKDSNVNFYGTRCQSTCNIIVTAIADFLPPTECSKMTQKDLDNVTMPCHEKDIETFVFKTNANYITQSPNREVSYKPNFA